MEREVTNATEELSHITTMNKPVRHRAATDMGGGASTSRWKHESISQHSRSLWVSIVIAMVLVAICEIGFSISDIGVPRVCSMRQWAK